MSLSFSFGQPVYLVALVAPIALLVWVWTRRGGRIASGGTSHAVSCTRADTRYYFHR